MNSSPHPFWASLSHWIQYQTKAWLKPTTISLAMGAIFDMSRSKADLIVENALLRQQLIVLNRQVKRPKLTNGDRIRLVLLARFSKFWHQALHIIQPDTLLRWHRDLFRLYWRYISNSGKKKQRIASETIRIIRIMIQENQLWGAERIRGELLKLGITMSKRTIQKYIRLVRKTPSFSHNWAAFIKNHIGDIWACDFTVAYDWLFHPIYIFVIMELRKRRIIHIGVTESPTDEWTTQQLREATPWGEHPKYLIHDRDNKFGPQFSALSTRSGIEVIQTPFRTPQANAFCERFMSSLKRECLDHTLVLHQIQLKRLVNEYCGYFNEERPHQGIQQRIPNRSDSLPINGSGYIRSVAFLGGLHQQLFPCFGSLTGQFPWRMSKVASTGGFLEVFCRSFPEKAGIFDLFFYALIDQLSILFFQRLLRRLANFFILVVGKVFQGAQGVRIAKAAQCSDSCLAHQDLVIFGRFRKRLQRAGIPDLSEVYRLLITSGLFLAQYIDQPTHLYFFFMNKGEM